VSKRKLCGLRKLGGLWKLCGFTLTVLVLVTALPGVGFGGRTLAQSGGGYDLGWGTVVGGGGTVSGGAYALMSLAGQPEVGTTLSGGDYDLTGGFWPGETPGRDGACEALTGVTISGATSGVTGTSYDFAAEVSPPSADAPITYTWSPEPGSGQGTSQATYTWATTGDQTVSVSVSNCDGFGTAANSHTINVKTPPAGCQVLTGVTIGGPGSGVTGSACTFTAGVSPSNADAPITYTWSPEPGSGQGTNQATYTWTTAGDQAVSISVSNCSGDGSAIDNHYVAISSLSIYLPIIVKNR
jgi:hypothetical protein